jgi:hypothetical protein
MASFEPSSVIVRNEEQFISNPVGEETIILNLATGDYLGLNAVGAFIWDALREPLTVSQLVSHLMANYDVDETTCTGQTMEYLAKMEGFGLLRNP